MRIDLEKWLFIGSATQKDLFFEKAQDAGIIEFIHASQIVKDVDKEQQLLVDALKILGMRRPAPAAPCHEKALDVATRCIQADLQSKRSTEKLAELQRRLQHISVLGEFSLASITKLAEESELRPQFVYKPVGDSSKDVRLFEIGSREGVVYYLWMGLQGESLPQDLHPMLVDEDAQTLRNQIQRHQQMVEQAQAILHDCKRVEKYLEDALVELVNRNNCKGAHLAAQAQLGQRIFVVQGWVGVNKKHDLEKIIHAMDIVASKIAPTEGEIIPTHLENRMLGAVGQDLVALYDVPASSDTDPSLWVLGFFALFFAMIIGDGGYGLLFLLGALYSYRKCSKGAAVIRFKRLAIILSLSCIAWGFLANAFFGMSFAPSNPLRKISAIHYVTLAKVRYHWSTQDDTYREFVKKIPELGTLKPDQAQEILEKGVTRNVDGVSYVVANVFADQILREFSLLLGAVHLTISLLRYGRRNWSSVGWVIFIVGSWLYLPEVVQGVTFVNYGFGLDLSTCAARGIELIYIGMSLSILLAIVQHRLRGLHEIMNVIQIFADTMSYLRLYALGLAGGIMASTFNDLAMGQNIFITVLIMVAGHIINITLSIMGGVIHGLRLNFLEWYHYSFGGGGRWHRPLKKIQVGE